MKTLFVSGIDTSVGKTVATGLMARWLLSRGVDAITVKMVQTGCEGAAEDVETHRAMCGGARFPEDVAGLTAPQIFSFPSSPLLAASLEGREVDVAKIAAAVSECEKAHQTVLVEGAGGLAVPLTRDLLAVDFARARGWPLVLVTCGRLGAINHTILSLEAASVRGMRIAGIVHNWHPDAEGRIDADAFAAEERWLAARGIPLSRIVRIPQIRPEGPFPDIDFSGIFE